MLAYDVAMEGLLRWPKDPELRQQQARALADSGSPYRANEILQQLYQEGHNDEETLGLLARTYKQLWLLADNPIHKRGYLGLACQYYSQGYELTKGYWTGINAASLALIAGQKEIAERLARIVRRDCQSERSSLQLRGQNVYWREATLGEAALVLGNLAKAESWYKKAGKSGRGQWANLNSTRRQARLILEHLGQDPHKFDACFQIPKVVVFSGHMIDQFGSPTRFPPALESKVRQAIGKRLKQLGAGIGYASASCGSDLLFLDEMLKCGGEINVILPYTEPLFRRTTVGIASDSKWRKLFDTIVKRAARVYTVSKYGPAHHAVLFDYTNRFMNGVALLRAQRLDTELLPLAVWDGHQNGRPGGTADQVQAWRRRGLVPEFIDIRALASDGPLKTSIVSDIGPTGAPAIEETLEQKTVSDAHDLAIRTMLFADAKGFSSLTDQQLHLFVTHFLTPMARVIEKYETHPQYGQYVVSKTTAGDGLFMVFTDVKVAGQLALDLRDQLRSIDWNKAGLPETLAIRIGLDAGPVYVHTDPITKNTEVHGWYVNRAARIEPKTPPGHVYASEPFAALAVAQGGTDFTCDYVGQVALPKEAGIYPMYHIRRDTDQE